MNLRLTVLHLVLVTTVFLSVSPVAAVDRGETYFKFPTPARDVLDKISRVISIDQVYPEEVYAYANDDELAHFETLGIPFERLPHPGKAIVPRMAQSRAALAAWDSYPSYETYVATMNQFASDHPGLCQIVNAGTSVQGRSILFARISDNVSVEEDEPEVMFTGTMHGDETTGFILSLRLIDSLLSAYGSDPYITRLVDSMEIWINPLSNPDGTYYEGNSSVYGARRYNVYGVDLNRNYPDPAEGDHPDGYSWQPETVAMMNLAEAHSFVISANFHGGAEVVNYPWDTWAHAHADEAWYVDICRAWAIMAQAASPGSYMESWLFPNGITNGYAWYRVVGGRQDYMIYWRGCREITVEMSNTKLLPEDSLPHLWDYNRQGMLGYLENALYGVRGIVTDASTGDPIAATVTLLGHDIDSSRVFTDPDVGDYHRMLSEGTYTIEFTSLGYRPDTVYSVEVLEYTCVTVNMALEPLAGTPNLAVLDHTLSVARRGENVEMLVTLVNDGDGNATGLSGVLSTSDPALTVTQNITMFPTIPGFGGSAQATTAFSLSIAADCPLNHLASLALAVTGAGGFSENVPFSVVLEPVTEGFESGSYSEFEWQFTGDMDWVITPYESSVGAYAAHSGGISHWQSTRLVVSVDVAQSGPISFDFNVSSELGGDFLNFFIDGIKRAAWSGSQNWNTVSFDVGTGWHQFVWEYEKDGSFVGGQDRALIDQIVFPALVGYLDISTSSLPNWTLGRPYDVLLDVANQLGTTHWIDKYGDLEGTGLALSDAGHLAGTPASTGPIQFTADVSDASGVHSEALLTVTINPLPQITTTSLPDARTGEAYTHQLARDGGTPPFSWTETTGQLTGSGLSLTSGGLLSGMPTVSGDLNLSITLIDASEASASNGFVLHIDGGCCVGRTGDANGQGEYPDEITLGDIMLLVDVKFVSNDCSKLPCLAEADVNQDGGAEPTCEDNVTLGDIMTLVDFLFITGPDLAVLPECL